MKREDKRTTVSLAPVLWEMAEEMMAIKGFNNNFSAYVADLIRRDREKLHMDTRPKDVYPSAAALRKQMASDKNLTTADDVMERMEKIKHKYPAHVEDSGHAEDQPAQPKRKAA